MIDVYDYVCKRNTWTMYMLCFFCKGYGNRRDLHYPLRRQLQMCIETAIMVVKTLTHSISKTIHCGTEDKNVLYAPCISLVTALPLLLLDKCLTGLGSCNLASG